MKKKKTKQIEKNKLLQNISVAPITYVLVEEFPIC